MKLKFMASLLLLSIGWDASAHEAPKYQQIDELFSVMDSKLQPGYAIGLISAGELVFAKGYGYANLDQQQKISANTAFNLASLSKQFTAATTALLIDRQKLNINDDLKQHWPDLPAFMSKIKVSHLIYMTSGLKEYYDLPSTKGGWSSEDQFTVDDAIEAVFNSGSLNFDPGTDWSYSNINYQLLAELVHKMSGQTFASFSQDNLFEPLAMPNTWVDAPIDVDRKNRAVSYVKSTQPFKAYTWQVAPRLSPHYGGSGVFSTLEDLAKWDRALYTKHDLGTSFSQLMLSTQKFNHDKDNDAFGLVHGSFQDEPTIWYAGSDYGVSTYMIRLPKRNQTIICLANFGSADCAGKTREIINILYAVEGT